MSDERYLSIAEAAERSGLSRSQLKLLAKQGRLAAFKIGKQWATTAEALDAYLRNTELRSHDPWKNKRSC